MNLPSLPNILSDSIRFAALKTVLEENNLTSIQKLEYTDIDFDISGTIGINVSLKLTFHDVEFEINKTPITIEKAIIKYDPRSDNWISLRD